MVGKKKKKKRFIKAALQHWEEFNYILRKRELSCLHFC